MSGDGAGAAVLATDLVDRVRARLAGLGVEPDPEEVVRAVRAESEVLHGHLDLLRTARLVREHLAGAGPLEALLASPGVTDVVVDGPGPAFVDRGRGLEETGVVVPTEAELRALAVRLAGRAGQRLDDARPWADGVVRSRDGMAWRLHAVLPPVAVDGTCLSLRVSRPAQATFDRLVESGTVPAPVEPMLRDLVEARVGYLVVGGTGSGKTTLLAALLGLVPPGERLLCVEDSPELRPPHPHVVRLVVRHGNVEGAGGVAMSDLVRQALRMRPDRIAVGEVRGGEVADLLAALNTGHDGSAGTVHANSPTELPARLEALGALGGLDRAALSAQVAASLRVVVGMRRYPDGRRGVDSMGVVRREADGIVVDPVWRADGGEVPGRAGFAALVAGRRP
ncbi:TadA family conjugal transfer-associated ATPase [Dietzia sp. UBA5065]|uniref:TadA family conjugal transfer-associated ATPase n=1 Tax=Dietzia sp. UBA5065 TaxID=1946422 RepID=UPI0025C5DE02|nr:TadA family conjugal transfer-associated ATPase [Dietzia sp. UBA5065]HMT50817.1 TadA family conjugal transfer-associated ATPase [Dietzia sp.]